MSATAMTQAEFVTEVANIIGRDKTSLSADQTTTYEDRIKQWLYWGHLTMARLYAFPELDATPISYTLGTSTNIYTFATLGLTRVRQILGITLLDGTSSKKLPQILWRTFQEDHPAPTELADARPSLYTIYGKRIELDRVSDDTYSLSIRINQYPENFSSSSDTSDFENKDDVIIAAAVTHAYISLQELEDAKYWAGVFADRFRAAVGPELDPGDWEPEGRGFDPSTSRAPLLDAHADPFRFFN